LLVLLLRYCKYAAGDKASASVAASTTRADVGNKAGLLSYSVAPFNGRVLLENTLLRKVGIYNILVDSYWAI
jgi:hypothetical protein